MYLKRLELQGFKSFLGRTSFEFGPGITAIVGPNGTGKSNVAESIRWVLGEQGARNIRARRLEDVIFSGSTQRAAVGMAEVAMTLDNAEGWLPVDYSEVVVARRAYRSGESEYLINKAKVRLRDVTDLFLRAQVGQNSYAFMGQGLVEEVLLMRPEERRRLLEEAADVRLLRTRLDEARDRLAATRENLERVNLLLDEIGPRLRQLEGQAARAAEQRRIAGELAKALQAFYGQLWLDSQEALTASRANLDQRLQELEVAQREIKAYDEGLAALSTAIEEQERELGARRDRRRLLDDEVHRLEQRRAFDQERLEVQTRRRKEIEDETQSLRGERSDLQHNLAAIRERERGIQPEIEDAKSLIATRRQELTDLEQEQGSIRRRVSEAEERLQRAQRGVTEAEAALARLAEDEGRLSTDATRRQTQQREVVTRLRAVGSDFKDLRNQARKLDSEVIDVEQERNGLTLMIDSGRVAVSRLETEALELNSRLSQLKAYQEHLQYLQSSAEGIDAGAKYLLGDDPERHGVIEGLIGLVREIVRVPPGLERAIEAALFENIEALVFENVGSALAALELLEERQAGRATIYAIDGLRTPPPLNIMREKGIIGVAARLVRCDNRFRPVVDALLGRTIVVESVQLAHQVLRRGMGAVVTMDGVLFRPNGSITGGASKSTAEVFTRQRELDELPEQIAIVESRLAEATSLLQRERDSLSGAQTALASAEPRLRRLREDHTRAQNDLIENRGELMLLRNEARLLFQDSRQSQGGRDWQSQRKALTEDRQRHAADIKSATEALQRDREALAGPSARRSELIDALTEATAAQADLEGEARSLARQATMLQESLIRIERQLHAREDQLRAIDAEIATLKAGDVSSNEELVRAREDFAALLAELEPAEGEFNHLVGRERSMREQLAVAHGRLLTVERAHLEAEANLTLRTEEIDALREVMESEGFRPEGLDVVSIGAAAEASGLPAGEAGRLPPIRGAAQVDVEEMRVRIAGLRRDLRGLGPVNEQAPADFDESKERYDFLKGQVDDLQGSEQTLLGAIDELEANIRERLKATFAVVDKEFQRYFETFFAGGAAQLVLTQPDDFANTGIEIRAQPPGKRVNTLAMLSGGERTLTSLALLLSLLEAHPSPICVLDEVDAALDEANVGRFADALRNLGQKTQFIVITHNPRTIEAADVIYGISMGSDNTSKVLSLKLTDAPERQ